MPELNLIIIIDPDEYFVCPDWMPDDVALHMEALHVHHDGEQFTVFHKAKNWTSFEEIKRKLGE